MPREHTATELEEIIALDYLYVKREELLPLRTLDSRKGSYGNPRCYCNFLSYGTSLAPQPRVLAHFLRAFFRLPGFITRGVIYKDNNARSLYNASFRLDLHAKPSLVQSRP